VRNRATDTALHQKDNLLSFISRADPRTWSIVVPAGNHTRMGTSSTRRQEADPKALAGSATGPPFSVPAKKTIVAGGYVGCVRTNPHRAPPREVDAEENGPEQGVVISASAR